MKRLLLLLFFAFTFSANAQDYELFPNPSDTLAFKNSDGNIIFIAFDSVTSGNTYWPQRETHPDFSYSSNSNCLGHLFDTAWCGYKIQAITPQRFSFHHTFYEFEIDLSSRNTSTDSIGWLRGLSGKHTIYAKYFSKSQQGLFNNQSDSVLTFEITVLDSIGNAIFNSLSSPLRFEVSKNNGLISIPMLYHSDQYTVPTYGSSEDYTRTEFHFITKRDIYDFQVGDVFHYYLLTYDIYTPQTRMRTYSNLEIIDKRSINTDSTVYRLSRVYNRYKLNTQSPPYSIEEIIYHDTINWAYGRLKSPISNHLTFQTDTLNNHMSLTSGASSFWLKEVSHFGPNANLKRSGLFTSRGWFYPIGNCLKNVHEPYAQEALYLSGLGRVWYYDINHPYVYEESLIYFKGSSGQTYGTPHHIGLNEVAFENQLKIYPNPTTDNLNIELSEEIQSMKIVIIDQLGRKLIEQSINRENQSIPVENLTPGTYIIKTESGKAIPFVKQ